MVSGILLSGCAKKKIIDTEFVDTTASVEASAEIEVEEPAVAVEDAIKEAIALETAEVLNVDTIPAEYFYSVKRGGRVIPITYPSKDYFGDGGEITKMANVYLPKGYDGKKRYSVLYLMHGIGGSESEWGLTGDFSIIKKVLENLEEKDGIEPFIIVTPNGRSSRNYAKGDCDYNSFYKFGQELRNDLIPFMDSNYATIADRDHRAMAGLSMGGMQTINIGLCECLDLISYFGAFSAAPTSYSASSISARISSQLADYPVNYFYNLCGLEDGVAYSAASDAAKLLPRLNTTFVEGENFSWQEVHGGHDFNVWYLGFYNFAKIAFRRK